MTCLAAVRSPKNLKTVILWKHLFQYAWRRIRPLSLRLAVWPASSLYVSMTWSPCLPLAWMWQEFQVAVLPSVQGSQWEQGAVNVMGWDNGVWLFIVNVPRLILLLMALYLCMFCEMKPLDRRGQSQLHYCFLKYSKIQQRWREILSDAFLKETKGSIPPKTHCCSPQPGHSSRESGLSQLHWCPEPD